MSAGQCQEIEMDSASYVIRTKLPRCGGSETKGRREQIFCVRRRVRERRSTRKGLRLLAALHGHDWLRILAPNGLAEEAVSREPVSGSSFPANRENYREFAGFWR